MKNIVLISLMCFAGIQFCQSQEIKKMDSSPLDLAVFRPDGHEFPPVARIIYSRPQKKDVSFLGI